MEDNAFSAVGASAHSSSDTKPSRSQWMAMLADAPLSALEDAWQAMEPQLRYTFLRHPETGLVMVQGRIGGTGRPFNLGEMTVTRCAVRLDHGTIGHAYVAGRSRRHAELAAVFDGIFQDHLDGGEPVNTVLAAIQRIRDKDRRRLRVEAAATRVDFFTMTRGDE